MEPLVRLGTGSCRVAQGLLRLPHAPGGDGRLYNISDEAPAVSVGVDGLGRGVT
ncbi:hypothetical protein [Streptomyces sp. NPDC050704]|uniref:hypothetical protein n=1 Tax=Streptomyces sp. NPDC050704 TaxID=3157219 RepID=UPI00342E9CFE